MKNLWYSRKERVHKLGRSGVQIIAEPFISRIKEEIQSLMINVVVQLKKSRKSNGVNMTSGNFSVCYLKLRNIDPAAYHFYRVSIKCVVVR